MGKNAFPDTGDPTGTAFGSVDVVGFPVFEFIYLYCGGVVDWGVMTPGGVGGGAGGGANAGLAHASTKSTASNVFRIAHLAPESMPPKALKLNVFVSDNARIPEARNLAP